LPNDRTHMATARFSVWFGCGLKCNDSIVSAI
jgi:hypothetical protein